MIKTIIEQERQRLLKLGYDCEMQTLSVPVNSALQQLYLGNDLYILTGIHISDEDAMGNINTVTLASPTEQITLTQQRMSALGTSIVKVFRNRICIVSYGKISDLIRYKKDNEETDYIKNLATEVRTGKQSITMVKGTWKEEKTRPNTTFTKPKIRQLDDIILYDDMGDTGRPKRVPARRPYDTGGSGNTGNTTPTYYVSYYDEITAEQYVAMSYVLKDNENASYNAETQYEHLGSETGNETIDGLKIKLGNFTLGGLGITEYKFNIWKNIINNLENPDADKKTKISDIYTIVAGANLTDMSDTQKNKVFSYMEYSTGQVVEQSISPYSLEFVRLVPIKIKKP